jgi:UDP-N-acetylglucosamine diphosphorylase/glucosamine-1-phosphate N-acetyltransferase
MNDSFNVILFDTEERYLNLLPLSFTRPISDFRIGITTIKEKWQALLPGDYSNITVDYLSEKYPVCEKPDSLFVCGAIVPDDNLVLAVKSLKPGEALMSADSLIAFRGERADFDAEKWKVVAYEHEIVEIKFLFDIFLNNDKSLRADFMRLTAGRNSKPLSETNRLIGPYVQPDGTPSVFIEEGATVEGAILNVNKGPIYIGKDAEIMEGSCLRGPIALCDHSVINMGAKIYGATTIGPYSKVGGEINNVVVFGCSNKAHDGYLGNAVIGEWCNIGAGVNASNLKNDYSKIRIWNYKSHSFMRTDLQFCGLIMGDHSKAGINCMFNTATVLGVGVNIHGSGFPRVFIPSFSEGSPSSGFSDVPMKKFFDIADRAMSRRGMSLTDVERSIFEHIHSVAAQFK